MNDKTHTTLILELKKRHMMITYKQCKSALLKMKSISKSIQTSSMDQCTSQSKGLLKLVYKERGRTVWTNSTINQTRSTL